jgi:hypothetical protein
MGSKVAALAGLGFAVVCAVALSAIGFSLLNGSPWVTEIAETIPGRIALLLLALALGIVGGVFIYFAVRPPNTKRLILSVIPIFMAAAFGGGFFPRGIAYTESETGMVLTLLTHETSTTLSIALAFSILLLIVIYGVLELLDRYIFDR